MGLRDLKFPEATISTTGGSFAVRGLTFADFTVLIAKHGPTLAMLYQRIMEAGEGGLSAEHLYAVGLSAVQTAPRLVADCIAAAANDPEAGDFALALPATVQLEALEQTMLLTFAQEGGAKKVLATVIRAIQGSTALVEDLKT